MSLDHSMHMGLLLAGMLAGCSTRAEPATRSPPMLEIARPTAHATAVVSLPRRLAPGAPLTGRVPPGSRVTANDAAVPVAADGGIDWPVPGGEGVLRVRVERPDGRVLVQRIEVDGR